MKYLHLLFVLCFISCQSRQEALFEKFETLTSKAHHLNERIVEISQKSSVSNHFISEISDNYHNQLVPAINLLFEIISKDLSHDQYLVGMDLMKALERFIDNMEKQLDIHTSTKTVIATVFLFQCRIIKFN